MKIQTITDMIGNTPLLKIDDNVEYYAKIEGNNLFGSIKDRAAKYLMENAYKDGIIKKDTVIIESSSGNFGVALAGICKIKGNPFICVVDPNITESNRKIIELLVEEIEKLCFNSEIEKETGPDQAFHKIMNDFEMRLRQYLFNVKVTRELIHMIQEYYLRSEGIDKVALEIQYKLFLKAGDKPNLYKSEEEIRQYLKACQQEIKSSEEWQGLNQVMNEYVYWCKVLKEDYEDMLELYQRLQTELLWKEAKEGKEENLLLYESGPYLELQEEVGNRFSDVLCEVRKRQVDMFITYLKENTSDKRAFMYSTKLREYSNSNSMRYEKLIEERIRELLLRSSFPIDNMTEDKNNTCYNILAVLYKYAREETETYKEQLLKECDKMESYRIKTLLRE